MTRQKKKKVKNKQVNVMTLSLGAEKYIREHPFLSAMYKDELLARDMEGTIHDRVNRKRKRVSG